MRKEISTASEWSQTTLKARCQRVYVLFYTTHTIWIFLFIGLRKKSPQLSLLKKILSWNGDTPEDKGCLGSSLFPHVPLPTWSVFSCSCISGFWIRDSASLWLLCSSWASCSCICSVGWWRRRATTAITHLVCSLGCCPALTCSPKVQLGKKHIPMPWY